MIDRKLIQIDDIKEGESRKFIVGITNMFPENVTILNTGQSCTCTQVKLTGPIHLKTNERSSMEIIFTPASTGVMNREAFIKYSREGLGEFTDNVEIKALVK